MTLRELLRGAARRIKGTRASALVPSTTAEVSFDTSWLRARFDSLDYLGPVELAQLDRHFVAAPGEAAKLAFGKDIVSYFTAHPGKLRLVTSSRYYLTREPPLSLQIAFVAANYMIGRSAACLDVANRIALEWPTPFAHILWARVAEAANGPVAEHAILDEAAAKFPTDMTVRLNLIENLIGTNRIADANRAVSDIRAFVERELADEIAVAGINQAALEAAIQRGDRFPEGDNDIYTDEMCRTAWASYYESFVTRHERQHGDRLLLKNLVSWVRSMAADVDVVLDFGTMCAQPLYEAALAAPTMKFIGTDRQEFLAELNREAYQLTNLSFDHGDIFEVMERVARMPGRKALVHIRTATTLYPRFVEELYTAAARLGFEHIYLVENAGLVRTRLEFLPFETMQEPAVITKHRLLLHNYRAALTNAGYRIKYWKRNRGPGLWRGDHPSGLLGSQYEIHATRTAV